MNSLPVVERYGRFDLYKKIGHGGMAEIWAARDREGRLPGEFVVKRLHRELESNRECVELFTTEADVTLLLAHPGIVRVLESGEHDGRYYLAMEYIRGWTLEDVIVKLEERRQGLPPDVAVNIVIQVLDVLEYVHGAKLPSGRELGLIHRDVTPSNIFVTHGGKVKLGDFGVAKMVGVESWTIAGSIKGKIGYLAPEQVLAQPLSQSLDRYAAAIVFYELLCGRRCFDGQSELEIMLKIRDGKIAKPRKVDASIPRGLAKIAMKALRRRVGCRYKSSRDFRSALLDYRDRYGHRVLDVDMIDTMVGLGLKGAEAVG